MPSIDISDSDFQRLQKIAVPLVDTPRTVVTRLLDSYEQANARIPGNGPAKSNHKASEFGPENIPPLVHAKLMASRFDSKIPAKTTWNSLVHLSLISVMEKCGSVQELRRLSGANLVQGKKEDEGYKYVPSHKFSYQGVSAEDAVKIVIRCAKTLGCAASIEFEWRYKDGAFRPGERGVIAV